MTFGFRRTAEAITCVRRSADCDDAQAAAADDRRRRRPPSSSLKFGLLNAQSVGNKFTAICDEVDTSEYDVFLLTETWHTASTDTALARCAPPGFSIVDVPRPTNNLTVTNHGGVAAVITDNVTYRSMRPPFQPRSFESMCFTVTSSAATVVVLLLYRPGSSDVTSEFFVEFAKLLESLALYKCQIIVAGDFNIHMEDVVNPNTKQLNDILDSFHCTQHVPLTPTHLKQRTLDLVVTKSDQLVERLQVDPPGVFSDHSLISWSVPI